MSPLLFAIYLEPLCRSIISDRVIRGFERGPFSVKVLAYADDVTLLCSSAREVCRAIAHVRRFCAASGASISWSKSSGSWLGSWSQAPATFAGLTWSTEPPVYLGVPLSSARSTAGFWAQKVTKLRDRVWSWKAIDLSVFSRSRVCNVWLASRLGYYLQVLPCSRSSINNIHRVFATFLWNSSYERTRRTSLFHSFANGGLHLTHMFARQLVWRVSFLKETRDPFLRHCIATFLKDELPGIVVSTVYDTPLFIWGFYKEVACAFRWLTPMLSLDFIFESSRRKLYWAVVDMLCPLPLYRCMFPANPGRDVLVRVMRMPLDFRVKDFFFRLHTGTLPVRAWLRSRGFWIPFNNDNCKLCPEEETLEHCFLSCRDATCFWGAFQQAFNKRVYLCPRAIRFLPVVPNAELPWDVLILLGLYALWVARRTRDRNDPPVGSWPVFRRYCISLCRYLLSQTGCELDSPWFKVLDIVLKCSNDY